MKTIFTPLSLRAIARLLSYPNPELRQHFVELSDVLQAEQAICQARRTELKQFVQILQNREPLELESNYVELFDRGRATSLHLFEHIHGDSRDRGPAMIDLVKTYEASGLMMASGELPDYLPIVLEFASTLDSVEAQNWLIEISHILNAIFQALHKRQSPYAVVLGALLDLAGEKAHAVKLAEELPLDESWEEPLAFDGCSIHGQGKPNQEQTLNFVKKEKLPESLSKVTKSTQVEQGVTL